MAVRYQYRGARALVPVYACVYGTTEFRDAPCQSIPGSEIDAAISQLVIATMSPLATEMALCVHAELLARQEQVDRQRQRQVDRAQYEVELARNRYLQVDPANRLVAASLEADWNDRLRALEEARAEVERQRQHDLAGLDATARERLATLSRDFAALWHDPATPNRERKRLLALLIQDVTLTRGTDITVAVRFRGGTTQVLTLPVPKNAWARRQTHPEAMALIRQWTRTAGPQEIADRLTALGYRSGAGAQFTAKSVNYILHAYRLGKVRERIRHAGHLTGRQMTQLLGLSPTTIKNMRKSGQLLAQQYSGRDWGYLPLDQQPEPVRLLARKMATSEQAQPGVAFPG